MGQWYEVRYLPYYWEDASQLYNDYSQTLKANEINTEIESVGVGR